MIHLFGDSWGYSYNYDVGKDDDQIFGECLAEQLSNITNQPAKNHSERGFSNLRSLNKFRKILPSISTSDTVIILQTDPLRSIFVPWFRHPEYLDDYTLNPPTRVNLIEISDILLDEFYSRLAQLQQQTQLKIILHGGCSKLNHTLAEKYNLSYTKKTSTEILIPDYKDCYFFNAPYLVMVRDHLMNTSYYKDNTDIVWSSIDEVESKFKLWAENNNIFSKNHTTPYGTELVAKYLADFLQQNSTN